MKKAISLFLTLALCMGLLAGCSNSSEQYALWLRRAHRQPVGGKVASHAEPAHYQRHHLSGSPGHHRQ